MALTRAVLKVLRPLGSRAVSVSALKWRIFAVTSEEQFKTQVLDSQTPVLVDFQADWCGPCKEMAPTLERVATELSVDLATVDVDQLMDLSMEYSVTAIPMVLAFKNGKSVDSFTGLQSREFIRDWVNKVLK